MPFHEVKVAPRALKRAMRRAIQGDPYKALVELILNADDSYRRLEDQRLEPSGVIEVAFDRQRGGGQFLVRDFAEGMSREEALTKITDWGDAHSGHAEGGSARGFFGRGGKDALFEMTNGKLETCKGNIVTTLTFVERGERRGVDDTVAPARAARRQEIGILSGNGTVASFDLPRGERVPQVDTVRETLTLLYPLRKVLSHPNRKVVLKYRGESFPLRYEPPVGEVQSDGSVIVETDGGPMTLAYTISVATQELDQISSERREGGILVIDDKDAAIDLSLFKFNRDPDAERLFGEVRIVGLREAMKRDDTIVTEERDGLNPHNATARQLIQSIEDVLAPVVKLLREQKRRHESEQSAKTKRKVHELMSALNELAARITGEQGAVDAGDPSQLPGRPRVLDKPEVQPDPICSIPSSLTLTPHNGTRVSVYFDTARCKGDVIIDVEGSEDVEFSPDQFTIDESKPTYRQDIELFGLLAGAQGSLVVMNDGGELSIPFKVVSEVFPSPPSGFAFIPSEISGSPGRARTLELYINTNIVGRYGDAIITIDDAGVAQLDRTSFHFDARDALAGIVRVPVKITGLKVGGSVTVSAECRDFDARCTFHVLSRRAQKPSASGFFSGLDWDDNKHPKCHYRADDGKMMIHCQEPTFRLLGVSAATYEDDRSVQVAVAEACTQAACQRIAQASIPGQGRRRAYLNPNDDVKRLEEDFAFIQELTKDVGPVVYRALVDGMPKARP